MKPRQKKIKIGTWTNNRWSRDLLQIQRGQELFILNMTEIPFADGPMILHSLGHKEQQFSDDQTQDMFAESQNFTQKFWSYFTDEEQQRMLPKLCQEALKGNKLARLLVHSGEKKT